MWRYGRIAIYGLVVSFTVAALVSAFRLVQHIQIIGQIIGEQVHDTRWTILQVEKDYLALSNTLLAYRLDPTVATEDVLHRFEVFRSRLPALAEGGDPGRLRRSPHLADAVMRVQATLREIEPAVRALRRDDEAGHERIMAALATFRAPLDEMLSAAAERDIAAQPRAALERVRRAFGIWFSVLLVSGAGLVWLVLAGRRETQLAHRQLVDAIESIPEAFVLYDRNQRLVLANSRLTAFNPAVGEILKPGVPMAELIRHSAQTGAYAMDVPVERWIAQRLEAADRMEPPSERVMSDGRVLLVASRRTGAGDYVMVQTDITEIKRTEALLRTRLAAIEAVSEGIAIYDAEQRLTYVNQAMARLYGYAAREELIGETWRVLRPEEERGRIAAEVPELLKARGVWRGEATGVRKDGSRFPVAVSLTALADGGVVSVNHDLTELRRHEAERARLAEQFYMAQRSEALGRLAGGIAHDFNNILAVILGYAEIVLHDLPPEHAGHAHLKTIVGAVKRARGLVRQILMQYRRQTVERNPVNLADAIGDALTLLRASVPSTISLGQDVGGCRGVVLGDAVQLGQVILNLGLNAADAIGDRPGRIDFSVEDVDIGAGRTGPADGDAPADAIAFRLEKGARAGANRLWIGAAKPGPNVRLTVRDDGCGMDRATLQRIFEPFFTTKPVGKGSGLGLAAVQGIVTAHGGAVAVESEVGAGTTFEIYLGADRAVGPSAAAAEPAPAPTAAPPAAGRQRIMVVDDEQEVAVAAGTLLRQLGYDCDVFSDPREAASALGHEPWRWDLLLTDQTMPHMTGDLLIRKAMAIRPDLPAIICTGFTARITEADALALGARAFLIKPLSAEELASRLHAVLAAARGEAR